MARQSLGNQTWPRDRCLELIRCSRPCARYYTWRHVSGGLALADLHRSGFGCDAATPMVVCADCARAVLVHLARYHLGSASPARTAQSSSACGCLAQGSSPRDDPAQLDRCRTGFTTTMRGAHLRRWHSQERIGWLLITRQPIHDGGAGLARSPSYPFPAGPAYDTSRWEPACRSYYFTLCERSSTIFSVSFPN